VALYQKALAIQAAPSSAPTIPTKAGTRVNVAAVYLQRASSTMRSPQYRQVLAAYEKRIEAPTTPKMLPSLNNMAWRYQGKHELTQEEEIGRRCARHRTKRGTVPVHPEVENSDGESELGDILLSQKKETIRRCGRRLVAALVRHKREGGRPDILTCGRSEGGLGSLIAQQRTIHGGRCRSWSGA